jgi:cytochrome c556
MGILGIAVATAAIAIPPEEAEQIIQKRIASFREIGTAYKHIGDELKSRQRDLPRIQESAQLINDRGADMLRWFSTGSEPPPRVPKSWLDSMFGLFSSKDNLGFSMELDSHAKLAVWTQRSKFEEAHRTFKSEAERMWKVAQSRQVPEISTQFRRLGEACKACHDVYREKLD